MLRRTLSRSLILLPIFILAGLAAAYFGFQLQRNVPPPQQANYLAAEKGYGVTIDLTDYDDQALADRLAAMRQSGLVWLRQPISWAEIEPSPGQFSWEELDRILDMVNRSNEQAAVDGGDLTANGSRNFKLIAVLHSAPTWARPAETPATTPPTEISDFGHFSRAFATRYGQQIDYYQIWHEPNLSANWGDTFVAPGAYTDMLREVALNIRTVDPTAHILTAALAATLEAGPLNLNELTYLDQLYQAGARRWFDIVAIQPYGLWTKPLDAPDPGLLNFRRAELVRQVMVKHGDTGTPLWATAFGWVALPADWAGRPSPWSNDLPSVQAPRTAAALAHARYNWPWLGPMLAARWDTIDLAANDPARGFALFETPTILEVFQTAAANDTVATAGHYPASHPSGHYSPGWRLALTSADIPRSAPRTLIIPFEGTRLDLNIRRGLFRANLWVTIDGQAANTLPQDGQGRSYIILYDPLRAGDSVTLARHLPAGRHEAVIEAEGGWGQWAIEGWTVANEADTRSFQTGLAVAGLLTAMSGLGLLWQFVNTPSQLAKLAWRWGAILISLYAKLGDRGQIMVTVALAAGIYIIQGLAGLLLLPWLGLAVMLRPDLGLILVTVAIFFFQIPVRLPLGSFSPIELSLALTVVGLIFRGLVSSGQAKYSSEGTTSQSPTHTLQLSISNLRSTDLAALTLVVIALLATLLADNFAVSIREWRVVVLESVLFYFLIRLGLDFSPVSAPSTGSSPTWAWRLINAFITGATIQATIALYLYFFTNRSIDAEGVHRALGLGYGSPNNLALVLGRAWPILLAVSAWPGKDSVVRRGLYGLSLLVVSLALYLTFSKGALLLGLPLGLATMALIYGLHRWPQRYRRVIAATTGTLTLFILALVPLLQTERFRIGLNFEEGSTAFFRLKLWQSSWAMLQDHWLLGLGLDNFLYQYRTRYILPEAWQEPDLSHPHNLILDFGTRLGLGGIAVLLWLQFAFWTNIRRLYRKQFDPLILGLAGSMVVFISHGLVDNSYFLVDLAFAFFLALGIGQRLAE